MPSMTLKIDGIFAVRWYGDASEASELEADLREFSAAVGQPPDVFARRAVLAFDGIAASERDRLIQWAALIYYGLSVDTRDPQRPGKLGDYLPVWDFEIDV